MDAPGNLGPTIGRAGLPPRFHRWRVALRPGECRKTSAAEWAGCLVIVEVGPIEVDCGAAGFRSFATGAMLALGWLPLVTIRNPSDGSAQLLAIRRIPTDRDLGGDHAHERPAPTPPRGE